MEPRGHDDIISHAQNILCEQDFALPPTRV
jgi:hypothetical protein